MPNGFDEGGQAKRTTPPPPSAPSPSLCCPGNSTRKLLPAAGGVANCTCQNRFLRHFESVLYSACELANLLFMHELQRRWGGEAMHACSYSSSWHYASRTPRTDTAPAASRALALAASRCAGAGACQGPRKGQRVGLLEEQGRGPRRGICSSISMSCARNAAAPWGNFLSPQTLTAPHVLLHVRVFGRRGRPLSSSAFFTVCFQPVRVHPWPLTAVASRMTVLRGGYCGPLMRTRKSTDKPAASVQGEA